MTYKIVVTLIMITISTGIFNVAASCSDKMTPYGSYKPYDALIQGAMLDLYGINEDFGRGVALELQNMKQNFCINTVNLYGLESIDIWGYNTDKDLLFNELKRLDMKAVIRIETYDADTFAFQESDLDYILERYDELLKYISEPQIRDRIAYLALNMPVDDGRVQARLGGINSSVSRKRQPVYAAKFVSSVRELLEHYGFSDARLYLSVFYGWDNTYNIPSYNMSGADGYFINNYSYPAASVPDETADNATLINSRRLQRSVDKFISQYGNASVVIEYGFHTVEYNRGIIPNQTAGLVMTKAAKLMALKATTDFYVRSKLNLRGFLYFGYNLYKEEGNPPAVMDWTLKY